MFEDMDTTDKELMEALRRGEPKAVDTLLAKHQERIYRFGLRMCGNEDDAKEVLQETLLAAFKGLREFREEAALSTWLFQIARSFCIKARRRPTAVSIEQPELKTLGAPTAGPDEQAHARQLGSVLHAAILALPANDREVVLLRDVEGLSAEEAAEIVGIEVGALKSRLHRARTALRKQLSGVLSPTAANESCPELAMELSAYSAKELDQSACARIEAHLARCSRCAGACEELKRTVSLCKRLPEGEVPGPVRAAVRRALLSL